MAKPTPKQILVEARALGTDQNVHPAVVAVSLVEGFAPTDSATMLRPSVLLTPVPNPVLAAALELSGATRRGRLSWSVGMGEEYNSAPLRWVMTHMRPGTVWVEAATHTTRGPKDLNGQYANGQQIGQCVPDQLRAIPYQELNRLNGRFPEDAPAALTVSSDGRVLWFKVITHMFERAGRYGQVNLNVRPGGKAYTEPKPVSVDEALVVLHGITAAGIGVVDDDNLIRVLGDRARTSVVAFPVPGSPALANLVVGVPRMREIAATLPKDAVITMAGTTHHLVTDAVTVAAVTAGLSGTILDPHVADMAAMAAALPDPDPRLRGYQQSTVGVHIATSFGFVNACAPGMGKTIMAARGMAARAAFCRNYRALVVTEANVRKQWEDELSAWWHGVTIVRVTSRKDAGKLAAALTDADPSTPVVVLLSYGLLAAVAQERNERASAAAAQAAEDELRLAALVPFGGVAAIARVRGVENPDQFSLFDMLDELAEATAATAGDDRVAVLGALLLDTHWHDLIADEAEVLRGTGSAQADALWTLRASADVALALTGTPINRGVDDLGRLMAWTRGQRDMFRGLKLSERFPLETKADQLAFVRAMGQAFIRFDTSEISDELPTIEPVVIKLTPTPSEKALAHAATSELKRVYNELMAALEMAQDLDPDNPEFEAAKETLSAARGAWLGGTTLARMAASDPAALNGSTSAGAALLAGQGLIDAANADGGTKRKAVVANVCARVADGEAVLVFTEFATVARCLIAAFEEAGIAVGAVTGGGGSKRDEAVASFQEGDLDVLVCTSAGERGLNLQRASTIVHYDLPWTPKGVIQRTGRAVRLSSTNAKLTVVFPLMEGTIEERVASLVVSRAVEAMRALDLSRGIDASKTDLGLSLAGLVDAVGATDITGDSLLEVTAALVA